MWRFKKFKTYLDQCQWIAANGHKFAIVQLFVNNGFAVEFKPLRKG